MATEVPNWVYGTRSSFSAGELTPTIEGRADLPLYQNGAKKIINWMILPSGGVTRRPGTEFIWAKTLVSKTLMPETLASETLVSEPFVSKSVEASVSEGSGADSDSEDDSLVLKGSGGMSEPPASVTSSSMPAPKSTFFDYGILDKEDSTYRRNPAGVELRRLMSGASSFNKASNFDLEDIKRESRKAVKGEIGRRAISGWRLHDVEDNGNCFYDAAVHQMELIRHNFLTTVPAGTSRRDYLRLHIQGENFRDEEWAEDTTFDEFVKKIDVILAIIDTRTPENGYVYYYAGDDGEVITHVRYNESPLPVKSTIKLAATGNHFLSVVSEPAAEARVEVRPPADGRPPAGVPKK